MVGIVFRYIGCKSVWVILAIVETKEKLISDGCCSIYSCQYFCSQNLTLIRNLAETCFATDHHTKDGFVFGSRGKHEKAANVLPLMSDNDINDKYMDNQIDNKCLIDICSRLSEYFSSPKCLNRFWWIYWL